jgi:hypothetical protein
MRVTSRKYKLILDSSLLFDMDAALRVISAAGRLFPVVLAVQHDGLPCAPNIVLPPVNGLKVFERVFTGPVLRFPKGHDRRSSTTGTVALFLWSKGKKGRILTSFRFSTNRTTAQRRTLRGECCRFEESRLNCGRRKY